MPDALVAAERLAESGLSTTWWDESFGRQASVVSSVGQLSLNGEFDDPYGYQVFDPTPSSVGVVATVCTPDLDAATRVLGMFGFASAADATPHLVVFDPDGVPLEIYPLDSSVRPFR